MRDSIVTTAIWRYLSQRGTAVTSNTLILSLESGELKKFRVQANNFYDRTSTLIKRAVMIRLNWRADMMMLSLFQKASLILAKTNSTTFKAIPGFVSKYVVVDAFLKINGIQKQQKIYLALINWLSEHEKRHWFPRPVEVWRVFSPCAGSYFIPVSRCAHLTEVIQFDRVMTESVTITVPLNH